MSVCRRGQPWVCRGTPSEGHVLARHTFAVPHEGVPAGERLVRAAVCDAGKCLASAEATARAVRGLSAVLLLITDRDDPAVADERLTAVYAACKHKVGRPARLCCVYRQSRLIPVGAREVLPQSYHVGVQLSCCPLLLWACCPSVAAPMAAGDVFYRPEQVLAPVPRQVMNMGCPRRCRSWSW